MTSFPSDFLEQTQVFLFQCSDAGPWKHAACACLTAICWWPSSAESFPPSPQMHSTTLSPWARLQHTSRASRAAVYIVSSADTKPRKRGKGGWSGTLRHRYTVTLQGSVANLIPGGARWQNRFVLTKEFNSAVIDSDNQILPWPAEFIF